MKRDGVLSRLSSPTFHTSVRYDRTDENTFVYCSGWLLWCALLYRVQCLCDASESSRKTAYRLHCQFFQRPNRFRATIKLINILKSRRERNPAAISTSIEHHGDALQLQLFIRARMNSIERKQRTHGTAIIVHYPSISIFFFSDVIY